MRQDFRDEPSALKRKAANKKRRGNDLAVLARGRKPDHIPRSNTFGNCASGSVAAPTMVATKLIRVRLLRRLPRIWLASHSSTSVSTPTARVGAQLSIAVCGDSAMVRGGTGRPEAEAA